MALLVEALIALCRKPPCTVLSSATIPTAQGDEDARLGLDGREQAGQSFEPLALVDALEREFGLAEGGQGVENKTDAEGVGEDESPRDVDMRELDTNMSA